MPMRNRSFHRSHNTLRESIMSLKKDVTLIVKCYGKV